MSKVQRHQQELQLIFPELIQTEDEKKLNDYLLANSNLPGRRGNLELAKAFTKAIREYFDKNDDLFWNYLISIINITPDQAPTNNPKEFLPFCATWAVGTIGAISKSHYKESLALLKKMASDSRWRIREAVANGIQELLTVNRDETIEEIETWILDDQWLLMRAVVTGVADPSLLQDDQLSNQALKLHKMVLNRVVNCNNRKKEEFRILRKGLAYSLSVVVQANPEEGFDYLNELTTSQDNDIIWILKQNLKKNRLVKKYPSKVKALTKQLK
ncbi:MAG: hypothetical protein ACFFFH_13640 [Candidatus Thorarchaeota archaeon]